MFTLTDRTERPQSKTLLTIYNKKYPEEIAFYDAVAGNLMTIDDQAFLRERVHEVIQTLKHNLKVDWTGLNLPAKKSVQGNGPR
jgi:hypothetical protein